MTAVDTKIVDRYLAGELQLEVQDYLIVNQYRFADANTLYTHADSVNLCNHKICFILSAVKP